MTNGQTGSDRLTPSSRIFSLKRLKAIYWKISRYNPKALREINHNIRNINLGLESALSPLDRWVLTLATNRTDGLFHPSYAPWRAKRIDKILQIYGIDWFKGKKVLELGAGHGDLGAFLLELGADVLCVDGRLENINYGRIKHRKVEGFRMEHHNLDGVFTHLGKFDLIIDLGLLYHLTDPEKHLKSCFQMSDEVLLESVVCDSTDPYKVIKVAQNKSVNEESLGDFGCRPSPFFVERITEECGFTVERHFSPTLNSGTFVYDWEHRNDGNLGAWDQRRFWRLHKVASAVRTRREVLEEQPA